MQPNLIACNVNSADVMSYGTAHVANPDDVMHSVHNMCVLASQASLHNNGVPQFTYWPGMCMC